MKHLQTAGIFLAVILSINLFDATFLNESLVNYIVFMAMIAIIAVSLPFFFVRQTGFVLPVQLIVISIFVSTITAYTVWNQPFKASLIEVTSYIGWILFFYLLQIRISISTLERITFFYAGLYVLLYFYQLAHADSVLFGWALSGDEFSEQRGIVRIVFPGAGIFILAVFMAINKLTSTNKSRILLAILGILGLAIPILQVTRQFIFGVVLIYAIHFLSTQSLVKKIVFITVFFAAAFWFMTSDNEIARGIIETQQRDMQLGQDYIRVVAAEFFISDFSPNLITRILGNGPPSWGISSYGIYIRNLADTKEFFLADVGLIGMYAMFGILPVIAYIMIWIKSFTIRLPKEYYYLKYYLWYLLLTSLTWYSVYHYSYLISTVFVLYSYQRLYDQQKTVRRTKKTLSVQLQGHQLAVVG